MPDSGPLTVAIGRRGDRRRPDRRHGDRRAVAALGSGAAGRTHRRRRFTSRSSTTRDVIDGHNLAGEPRGSIAFEVPADRFVRCASSVGDELVRRGAWARCVQTVGVLDAAADLTVAHTRERRQFGRPLAAFQAVQHSLAAMAGEIERARAATTLAIAAAADYGFGSAKTDYAVTVAKVAVGRAVEPVTTIAHQLHGAIGVTSEHRLWLATMRARSWVDDFGSTAHYARRLGRMALAADEPWDVVVSCPAPR